MLISMGDLRRTLHEASIQHVNVEDLKPGDRFINPNTGDAFVIRKAHKHSRKKGLWLMIDTRSGSHATFVPDNEANRYKAFIDKGEWFSSPIRNKYVGLQVERQVFVGDDEFEFIGVQLRFATGFSDANNVNDALKPSYGNYPIRHVLGYPTLQVVGFDSQVAQEAAQMLPASLPMWKLVLAAFGNEQDVPLSEEEIRRRIARMTGVPYVPRQAGRNAFSVDKKGSLVALGILQRHGAGKNATFTLANPEKPDWRSEETTPEDYYAT